MANMFLYKIHVGQWDIAPFLGPLIQLPNFHPSCIRWCLMHVLHLGLLFTANGSGLNLEEIQKMFSMLGAFGFHWIDHRDITGRLHQRTCCAWRIMHTFSCLTKNKGIYLSELDTLALSVTIREHFCCLEHMSISRRFAEARRLHVRRVLSRNAMFLGDMCRVSAGMG